MSIAANCSAVVLPSRSTFSNVRHYTFKLGDLLTHYLVNKSGRRAVCVQLRCSQNSRKRSRELFPWPLRRAIGEVVVTRLDLFVRLCWVFGGNGDSKFLEELIDFYHRGSTPPSAAQVIICLMGSSVERRKIVPRGFDGWGKEKVWGQSWRKGRRKYSLPINLKESFYQSQNEALMDRTNVVHSSFGVP